jgi:hypothetical protein
MLLGVFGSENILWIALLDEEAAAGNIYDARCTNVAGT